MEVPLFIEKPVYNFRICPYNCMYREKFILHNRGNRTMQMKIHCPKEMEEFLEFNPVNGYIQPLATFEIWAKFKPNESLITKAKRFLTGEEKICVILKVVSELQAVPVLFKLESEFTTDELEIVPQDIDFGVLYDQMAPSVKVKLTNHSKLPQKISFFQIPKEVTAEPDKGSLHILPLENVTLNFIYKPPNDGFYGETNGIMWLRSVTGNIVTKEHKLTFKAKKEKCPIIFDKSKLSYPCLAEGESYEALVAVSLNSGYNKDYMIEFSPPHYKLTGLKFCPTTAIVKPGKQVLIQILYDGQFRNLDPNSYEEIKKEFAQAQNVSIVGKNKFIEEAILKSKEQVVEETKDKGKKKEGKKEEKKAAPAKKEEKKTAGKKTKKQEEEEELARVQAEEQKKKEEEEHRKKLAAEFDKAGELNKFGGQVYDYTENLIQLSQHYQWIIPCSFMPADKQAGQGSKMTYIVVNTTVPKLNSLYHQKSWNLES